MEREKREFEGSFHPGTINKRGRGGTKGNGNGVGFRSRGTRELLFNLLCKRVTVFVGGKFAG